MSEYHGPPAASRIPGRVRVRIVVHSEMEASLDRAEWERAKASGTVATRAFLDGLPPVRLRTVVVEEEGTTFAIPGGGARPGSCQQCDGGVTVDG